MTPDQVEKKVIELIYSDPFVPFIVEMTDGRSVEVPHPRLAIDGEGAGFIDLDGALTDFDFKEVSAIRVSHNETVA